MCRRVFFDVIDEGDKEEYHREILRRVGQPPQQGNAPGDTPRLYNTWYDYFVEAAAEQYQESLVRAREVLVKSLLGHPDSILEESHIANQATAFRTLAVREMLLYLEIRRDDGGFPPLVGPIRGPLTAEQLEALFQELRRRGAFEPDLHPFEYYRGLTDRQMWELHREEGESYSTAEEGYWSLSLV